MKMANSTISMMNICLRAVAIGEAAERRGADQDAGAAKPPQ
jgi:hypothetical protein